MGDTVIQKGGAKPSLPSPGSGNFRCLCANPLAPTVLKIFVARENGAFKNRFYSFRHYGTYLSFGAESPILSDGNYFISRTGMNL